MSPTTASPPSTAELVQLYATDPTLTLAEIARQQGVSRATISARFRKAGVVTRRPRKRPESDEPMSAYTLRFPWPLYRSMQAAVVARRSSMRDLVRLALRAEIQSALGQGEIAGPQFSGSIGEAPEDCAIGPTTGQVTPHRRRRVVGHTFRFTRRFWRQVKALAVVRGVSLRALCVQVLARSMASANGSPPARRRAS